MVIKESSDINSMSSEEIDAIVDFISLLIRSASDIGKMLDLWEYYNDTITEVANRRYPFNEDFENIYFKILSWRINGRTIKIDPQYSRYDYVNVGDEGAIIDFIDFLDEVIKNFTKMSEIWTNYPDAIDKIALEKYPFDEDFSEVIHRLVSWKRSIETLYDLNYQKGYGHF